MGNFEVYVIVAGLALVVPQPNAAPPRVQALFANVSGGKDYWGQPFPKHDVTLNLWDGNGPVALKKHSRIEIERKCGSPNCPLGDQNADKYQPNLGILSNSHVRNSCLDMSTGCRGRTFAIATLQGAWQSDAMTLCEDKVMQKPLLEDVDWELRPLGKKMDELGDPLPDFEKKLGNAYLFSAPHARDEPLAPDYFALRINGDEKTLPPANKEDCKLISEGVTDNCSIIDLRNITHDQGKNQHQTDVHFTALYGLMTRHAKNLRMVWAPWATGPYCKKAFRSKATNMPPVEILTPPGDRCGGGNG